MAWHEKADAGYPWSVTSEGAIFRPLCGPSLSAPLATPPNHVSFGRALEGCWRRPRRHDSTRCDWLLGGATCRADRSSLRNDTDPRVVVSSSLLRPPPSSGHCRTSLLRSRSTWHTSCVLQHSACHRISVQNLDRACASPLTSFAVVNDRESRSACATISYSAARPLASIEL